MRKGELISIYITPESGKPMLSQTEVLAVPGLGLDGDRFFNRPGIKSKKNDPGREVTLIEIEAIEALRRDYDINFGLGDSRRNLVTRDVPLNHLVNREFFVGEVLLSGIRLCEPCSHLAKLTHEEVLPALVHRGGLRAQILTEGIIRVGDEIAEKTK